MTLDLTRRSAIALAASALAGPLRAQDPFPVKTIQVVVPYGAGGSTDVIGRSVAEGLTRELGKPAVVINRPGAGTVIGASSVATAAPDGHTLLVATPGIWVGSVLYRKTPYKYFDAFSPVSLVGKGPMILSLNPKFSVKTLEEFIEYAKSRPDQLTYADVGTGTTSTLTTEYFLKVTGIRARPIPYGGSTPALTDLIGGTIDFFFDGFVSSLPHVQAGKLRGLAITHGSRLSGLPGVPTFREAGFAQLELHVLYAILAPVGTPAAIVAQLNAALDRAMRTEQIRTQLMGLGIVAQTSSAAELHAIVIDDLARWRTVVKVD